MGDQQPEDDIDLPNTTPEFHIARQHLENRLAAEREAPPPFPNILEPPLQEDGLPIPRNRQIEQLEDVALPHVYSLLLQYAETPNLPISVQHLRDNLWALMHDEDIPWPENLDFPSVFPELELAALQEIQYHIRRLTHERLRDPIPRDNAPNTPEWILALFPRQLPLGQRNAEDIPICAICIQELPARVSIARPCNHWFCSPCLDEWIRCGEEGGREVKCPICFVGIVRIGNNGESGHRVGEFLGWDFESIV
ncbi:hypothetical protein sscle_03g026890 [Sclerotinia sclerotiorum 1980 UF-70]|uniref:RING-type domain-containing protein n=1 Tax=Sclerotinia sclerotiorum (strain ATCC 18683 / 1980 / Ss-1) TaxID=665079 RepID=A0A1D9PZ79_SCLS1|nr:hypothetical protein sscle_03g026890 [Sclerotinia sclerotiorum 1980 UF-70]